MVKKNIIFLIMMIIFINVQNLWGVEGACLLLLGFAVFFQERLAVKHKVLLLIALVFMVQAKFLIDDVPQGVKTVFQAADTSSPSVSLANGRIVVDTEGMSVEKADQLKRLEVLMAELEKKLDDLNAQLEACASDAGLYAIKAREVNQVQQQFNDAVAQWKQLTTTA